MRDRDPFLFETSVPGIFAAGDVRAGANRRVAAAVGANVNTRANFKGWRADIPGVGSWE